MCNTNLPPALNLLGQRLVKTSWTPGVLILYSGLPEPPQVSTAVRAVHEHNLLSLLDLIQIAFLRGSMTKGLYSMHLRACICNFCGCEVVDMQAYVGTVQKSQHDIPRQRKEVGTQRFLTLLNALCICGFELSLCIMECVSTGLRGLVCFISRTINCCCCVTPLLSWTQYNEMNIRLFQCSLFLKTFLDSLAVSSQHGWWDTKLQGNY